MMRIPKFLVSFFLLIATSSHAQDQNFFSVGVNRHFDYVSIHGQDISKTGFFAEFLLPVKLSNMNMFFKTQFSYHGMRPCRRTWSSKTRYVSALNELLIGKKYRLTDDWYIYSMFGLGVFARAIYSPGSGIACAYISLSYNNYLMHSFETLDFGINVNINYLPVDGYFYPVHEIIVKLGLTVAK